MFILATEDEIEEIEEEDLGLFLFSKEDIILGILILFGGILLGYFGAKLLSREEKHFMHQYPMPRMEDDRPFRRFEPAVRKFEPAMKKKKEYCGGHRMVDLENGLQYDKDEEEVVLPPITQYETWTIKRDQTGDVVDAYKSDTWMK